MRILKATDEQYLDFAEQIYHQCFDRYISPKQYEQMIQKNYTFIKFPFGGGVKNEVIALILRHLWHGNFIRGGYMATSIKNYHDHYIIFKP